MLMANKKGMVSIFTKMAIDMKVLMHKGNSMETDKFSTLLAKNIQEHGLMDKSMEKESE